MSDSGSLLVVEDDEDIAASLEMILGGEGYAITLCDDGAEALERSREETFDVVLTDFRLPGMGGLELMAALRADRPLRPVILMTAHGNTQLAIESTKKGAFDYLLKPFDIEELLEIVGKAVRAGRTMGRRVRLGTPAETGGEPSLLGSCRAMQRVYKEIGRYAETDATVLILGETGTGKELVARAIYQHSDRADAPFVAVNCGAIPENLLESELFGHVRGAFTGATSDRVGRFEQANGGTLFLDEIGDLPLPVQVKLLRVLQERVIQPLGGNREIPVDVRIITATHQPLAKLIEKKEFREDLYFRINTAVINLPPLREREGDLAELVAHFHAEAAADYKVTKVAFSKPVMKRLERHDWPGNIRELRNVVRQIVLRGRGFDVGPELVTSVIRGAEYHPTGKGGDFEAAIAEPLRQAIEEAKRAQKGTVHRDLVGRLERRMIETALDISEQHLGNVCEWLGISRVTLRKKLNDFGIQKGSAPRSGGKKD